MIAGRLTFLAALCCLAPPAQAAQTEEQIDLPSCTLQLRVIKGSAEAAGPRFIMMDGVPTTILHGLHDTVIAPEGSRQFADELGRRVPGFPLDLRLIQGDHRLSSPEHLELFRQLVIREA